MKSFLTPFKVGLVMIAAFAAFAYMFGTVSQKLLSEGEGYTVTAHISDATGLAEQSRVMMAGIAVGVVEEISLDGSQALLRIRMRPDVVLYSGIPQARPDGTIDAVDGAAIAKKQASLLGDYYLELTPGLRGERLGDGDEIPNVIRPIGPDTLFEQLSVVATNIDRITRDVQQVTQTFSTVFGGETGVARVDQIVADLQTTVRTLNEIASQNQDSLNRIVVNVEGISDDVHGFTAGAGQSLDGILADVAAMTTELRFIIGQSSGDVAEGLGTLRSTLSSMQLALDSVNYSLENVQEITDRVADGEGTLGALINDPTIHDETADLLHDAGDIVGGLNAMQTWVEMRSEYGMQNHSFKNYLTLNLRPNERKWYVIELVDDPRGETETVRTVTAQSDPDGAPALYEERTVTTEDFKVSVYFGGRTPLSFLPGVSVGGRWGIIESSGGLGANLWAWRDNWEYRMELFDFGENPHARLRMSSLLRGGVLFEDRSLWSRLFVQGGADDILNEGSRDWFVGGGLLFNDRDLRSLFLAAPTPSF